jgi:hypothetical protein
MNLDSYECFTCLKSGTVVNKKSPSGEALERDDRGQLQYAWKHGTSPLAQRHQQAVVRSGGMKEIEGLIQLRDRDSDEEILAHAGSVYWNEFRQRWVAIFTQLYGKSMLGEVWYSEANSPLGPWAYAVRIATHGNYSFYNPKQHPMLDAEGGRFIFFEGTYSHTFSGNPRQTPWYDYNQLMYRLDLSDRRLVLPAPVFRGATRALTFDTPYDDDSALFQSWSTAPWFALDRPTLTAVAVMPDESGTWEARSAMNLNEDTASQVLFYAVPADATDTPAATVALYEYSNTAGERRYDIEGAELPDGYMRAEKPLCRVWRSPYR